MEKYKLSDCKKHGNTSHCFVTSENVYRCVKCRSENVQRRRHTINQKAIEYKGGKCIICNYNRCNSALEFHHLDPNEKEFGFGIKGITHAWEKVRKELDKCILVCATCHREIHANYINVNDYIHLNITDTNISGNKDIIIKEKLKKQKKEKLIKITYVEKQQKYIDAILNSNIDFNKHGWVNFVALIINQKPQKVNNWMKRFMFEFYTNCCFKRKIVNLP
jgi:hypothetical protein